MPKVCAVGECKSRSSYVKNEVLRFFSFPRVGRDPNKRRKWVDLCGRKDAATGKPWCPREDSSSVYICSRHFIQGKPSQESTHPDYFPSLELPSSNSQNTPGRTSVRRFDAQVRRSVLKFRPSCEESSVPDVILERETEAEETDALPDVISPETAELVLHPSQPPTTHAGIQANLDRENVQWLLDIKDEEIEKLKKKVESQDTKLTALESKVVYLGACINTAKFSTALICENDQKSVFYTGLYWGRFLNVFRFLNQYLPPSSSNAKNTRIDQFFFTLVRLRQNDSFEKLADHAGIAKTTMIEYFWRWIDLIFSKCRFMLEWPERDYLRKINPPHFHAQFPRLTCIIDCFEIFIESASNLNTRSATYSHYKSHTTAKYLIGCTALGSVSFLSKGWGGRASDVHIVKESGFINPQYHHPGDQILADRGFTFTQEMATVCGAELIIPAFIKGKDQFSAQEVEVSRKIASVRIHIERVIGLMKNRFGILQQTIPLRMVQSIRSECEPNDFSNLDKIIMSCAILCNFGESIVYRE